MLTTLPGKAHPRFIPPPPGAATTSGAQEKQKQEDTLACLGSPTWLVPACCSSPSPAVHSHRQRWSNGHPAPRATHSSK